MVKCRWDQQEKVMNFDYREKYLKGVYQTKYYYGSVKKTHSHSLLICRLIRKSIMQKKIQVKKTDSNFDFFQTLRCLVLMRF